MPDNTDTAPIAKVPLEETPAFKKDPLGVDAQIAAAMTLVLTFPNVISPDALIVPQERGETQPLMHALNLYDPQFVNSSRYLPHRYLPRYLLIAGNRENVDFSGGYSLDTLLDRYVIERTDGITCQGHTTSVKGQTDWIAEKIVELRIDQANIFSSQWHLPRVFLNMLKSLIKIGAHKYVAITPVVVPVSWTGLIPGGDGDATPLDWLPEEINAIRKYQEKGDVATLEEVTNYLCWLTHQSGVEYQL